MVAFTDLFGALYEAQAAGTRAVRPGVACEAVDAAARDVIDAGGPRTCVLPQDWARHRSRWARGPVPRRGERAAAAFRDGLQHRARDLLPRPVRSADRGHRRLWRGRSDRAQRGAAGTRHRRRLTSHAVVQATGPGGEAGVSSGRGRIRATDPTTPRIRCPPSSGDPRSPTTDAGLPAFDGHPHEPSTPRPSPPRPVSSRGTTSRGRARASGGAHAGLGTYRFATRRFAAAHAQRTRGDGRTRDVCPCNDGPAERSAADARGRRLERDGRAAWLERGARRLPERQRPRRWQRARGDRP